jgi:hypothetical protein
LLFGPSCVFERVADRFGIVVAILQAGADRDEGEFRRHFGFYFVLGAAAGRRLLHTLAEALDAEGLFDFERNFFLDFGYVYGASATTLR